MNGNRAWPERHFVKLRGKIVELTDAEYSARADRIAMIRSEYALADAKEKQQLREAQAQKSQVQPPDPFEPGVDLLGDYMRQRGI